MIKVAQIGVGYWGPNLARNFYELPTSELIAISDQKDDQLKRAQSKYPEVKLNPLLLHSYCISLLA